MNPQLALILTYLFVFWLFRRDIQEKPNITSALWLPIIWLLIIATRSPTEWCTLWGVPGFNGDKGNLDSIIYLLLISKGFHILLKRNIIFSEFAIRHRWLIVLLLYSLIAVLWADQSFVAFKRWIKILGHPIMALIIVTEPDPPEAMKRLIKRASYVILPISIMLIKYFPAIGRGGSGGWITELEDIGITIDKNQLGANCWLLGVFLFWMLLEAWSRPRNKNRRNELILIAGLLYMDIWLLVKAGSATSWLVLLLATATFVILGRQKLNKNLVGVYAIGFLTLVVFLETSFEASAKINEWRGKQDTIEGRGRLQEHVLNMGTNPIIGAGFESFWSDERKSQIWSIPHFQWRPNQAHNGYIEMYLNLGIIGLILLIAAILEIYYLGKRELLAGMQSGRWRLACLLAIIAYNWTEAAYKGLSVVYFLFFLIAVTYPNRRISKLL